MAKPRSPRSALVSSLDLHRYPVYLLDSELRLMFGNEALQAWLASDWDSIRDRTLGEPDDRASVRARQWSRILLPPPHCRDRSDLTFTISLPESDESLKVSDAKSVEFAAESLEGRVVKLTEGETHWLLVLVSASQPLVEPLPARLLELHQRWEQAQRQASAAAADLLAGDSARAHRLREQVTLASRGTPRLSIVGPPGSGHELIANWILDQRPESARGPIATLECTLLDAELLQSTYRDLVREAQGSDAPQGCLVLLNVDRLGGDGQLELLNLLRFPKVPFNTIVTSLRPLDQLAYEQRFDSELATRLDVLSVHLPPLQSRSDDLPLLAHATLQRACETVGNELLGWSDAALARLQRHAWPNNFDELLALAQRMRLEAKGPWVQPSELPKRMGEVWGDAEDGPVFRLREFRLEEFLRACESEIMELALKQCRGNKTKAARLLGLSRGGFHRRWDALAGELEAKAGAKQASDAEPNEGGESSG